MSDDPVFTLSKRNFPALLREIPDPPKRLFVRGTLPDDTCAWLCVVGSRKYSSYGAAVCQKLIRGLSGYPVVVVSGLALGIDSIAHTQALEAGLTTVAVPGSGVDDAVLYPSAHIGLARTICRKGGAIISENEPQEEATVWSFPKRNRIMAGLCHATLIIEAHEKSGTLITARLSMEYNRDVLVVPGPITSPNHAGSNGLLREGAQAITKSEDILQALGIPLKDVTEKTYEHFLPEERVILEALASPKTADDLSRDTGMPVSRIQMLISTLEIKKCVVARLGTIERCV